MSTTAPAIETSHREWEALRDFIDEVEQDQRRERLVASFVEWRMAVKQLRRVQTNQLVWGEPSERNARFDEDCLHALLTIGETLERWSDGFASAELAVLDLTQGDMAACVEELRQNLREYRHDLTGEKIEKIRARIFSGAA